MQEATNVSKYQRNQLLFPHSLQESWHHRHEHWFSDNWHFCKFLSEQALEVFRGNLAWYPYPTPRNMLIVPLPLGRCKDCRHLCVAALAYRQPGSH
jgi:hypothetical protein